MCMSGAHYIEEEEELDPKYHCSYSGLPSVLSYQNKHKIKGDKK